MLNKFDYSNINYTLPNRTFEGSQTILLNNERKVELIQCGPAHTKGDCIVHVPDAKICYAGDLLFIGGTPIVWEGPFDKSM